MKDFRGLWTFVGTILLCFLIYFFFGCEVPSDAIVGSRGAFKDAVILPPQRPALPEGWEVVGNMYVNSLHQDTIRF